ncbi:hypothetical protein CB1_000245036 [Camelus ferus]|nr:hypothetical protein CB1_000245036 [Camelus ferus]
MQHVLCRVGAPQVQRLNQTAFLVGGQVQTKEQPPPPAPSQSVPAFYFPRGRPQDSVNVDAVIAKIERTFAQFPHERATLDDMGRVAKPLEPRPRSVSMDVPGPVPVLSFSCDWTHTTCGSVSMFLTKHPVFQVALIPD